LEEAEPLLREFLRANQDSQGEKGAATLAFQSTLAVLLCAQGNLKEPELLRLENHRVRREAMGDDHPLTRKAAMELAQVQKQLREQ
jgi:hypothetical protein